MCLAIYIGTDVPVEPIPWDKKAPSFHVDAIRGKFGDAGQRKARERLGKPYVYDVGAHTGCACGFLSDDPSLTPEELAQRRDSLSALRSFLDAQEGPIEMLVAWMGDEGRPADTLTLSPDEAAAFRFDLAWDKPYRITILARS